VMNGTWRRRRIQRKLQRPGESCGILWTHFPYLEQSWVTTDASDDPQQLHGDEEVMVAGQPGGARHR
jgi:hypothetical protein